MSPSTRPSLDAGLNPNWTTLPAQHSERATRVTEIVYALFVMATGILLLATVV